MPEQSRLSKFLAMHREPIAFWTAAALGLAVAIWVNVEPYFAPRGVADGYEDFGFPFVFRRLGGIEGQFRFTHWALSADIVIAIMFSWVAGRVARYCVGHLPCRARFAWCAGPPPGPKPWQFGLRQLFLITAIVGAAFAADRIIAAVASRWWW